MENRLIASLGSLMGSFDQFNVTVSENPHRDVERILWNNFFSKTDEKIYDKTIADKDAFFKHVCGIDFCAFERLTKVSWEHMFRASFINHELFPQGGMKIVNPWQHIIMSSAVYSDPTYFLGRNDLFTFEYSHTGKEFVLIDGILYLYGEAQVIGDRPYRPDRTTPHVRVLQPTFLIDERLLPSLVEQPNWNEVVEIIYTLYYLSSHDGMIHSLFMETDKSIRRTIETDPIMRKLNEQHYYCYDMYEMNFARMMRAIFSLADEANPSLNNDLKLLWGSVSQLSSTWPMVLRKYVTFIATERLSRLIKTTKAMFTNDRYMGGVPLKNSAEVPVFKIEDFYLYEIIHTMPEREALVHLDGYRGTIGEISYEDMTKFMCNCYPKS